jgi:hypothetical protein
MGKKVKRVYDENGNVTHKVCSKCGELKGIDEFNVNKRTLDGCQCKCKKCQKQYYEENKEHSKQYYEENKEHSKQYYEENKERIKEYSKQYYEENKERIKEYSKQYKEGNKEQTKEYNKRYWENLCDEAIARIKAIVEQDPTRYDYRDGEEIYGIIYLVCCKPTNKYYVGQTTNGFDNRYSKGFFNDEKHEAKEGLMEDLKKYGEDSFEFTKIFKVAHNKEELDGLEVYYIDHFDSYYNGYNRTRGNHRTNLTS